MGCRLKPTRCLWLPRSIGLRERSSSSSRSRSGPTSRPSRLSARAAETVGRENVYFWVFQDSVPILLLFDQVPQENIIVVRLQRARLRIAPSTSGHCGNRSAAEDQYGTLQAPPLLGVGTSALQRSLPSRRVGIDRFTRSIGPYCGRPDDPSRCNGIRTFTSAPISICWLRSCNRRPGECPLPKPPIKKSRARRSVSSPPQMTNCGECSKSSMSGRASPCGGPSSC